jgi:hypothetical protein
MQKTRSEVYDTYWETAAERQQILFNRFENKRPLTSDPIFVKYKFCNVYRAADRVSQFLIKEVIYSAQYSAIDTLFRIFLFRLLNRPTTWQQLESRLGSLVWDRFSFADYDQVLGELNQNQPIYGNAFILCANKAFGYARKHQNHLALIESVFKSPTIEQILAASSLEQLYRSLRQLPLIGNFMAYQIAIDFNYSNVFNFDENDFTVAGPGAVRGINKCFIDPKPSEYMPIILELVKRQDSEFQKRGLNFHNLGGRPMSAVDIQGWFCETDKYCRVKYPRLKSNRQRIKTTYRPDSSGINYYFPPKWRVRL